MAVIAATLTWTGTVQTQASGAVTGPGAISSLSASTFARKWTFFDGSILSYPVASPANDIVFTGGAPNYGVPGFVRAIFHGRVAELFLIRFPFIAAEQV
jgi:hypothetical protein